MPKVFGQRGLAAFVALVALSPFWAASSPAADAIVSTALAPRSGPAGATLFARLPAETSGITVENRYADPRMWGELFQEFKFGAIGTGVAIGDYDDDGDPDVFVVSKTESSRLYENLGGWTFKDVTESAGLLPEAAGAWERGLAWAKRWMSDEAGADHAVQPWQQGATFADVNNDGHLDLYVCRFGAPNQLFINRGDGTFNEEAAERGLALVDASGMAAFCDYDRDGWLDVYLQTNLLDVAKSPKGQPDHLFRNKGDGTFEDVTESAGIAGETQGHSAIWWDYDEDGWPDLYVANDFATPDTLYRNLRDGTFRNTLNEVVPYQPHSSMGADLGDVNNDGRIDLLVADMAATTHEKDHRGMAKIRALLLEMPEEPGTAPQYMRNALFLNTGTGRMREAAQMAGLAATDWTWSVGLQDLDNDGWLDAHFTNGMVRELHNTDLVRRASGSESVDEAVRLEKATPPLQEANLAYRNLGDLRFEAVGQRWGLDQMGVSFGAAFADFDGDGDMDLIHTNYEEGVTLLRNDAAGGHRVLIELRGTRSNRFGVGARVRLQTAAGVQVRELVLARGYLSSGEPILHFGLGDAERIVSLTVAWPSGHVQVLENLEADRRYRITEPASNAAPAPSPTDGPARAMVEVAEGHGLAHTVQENSVPPSTQQPLLPRSFDRLGPAAAVGDLNDDGLEDLVLGGTPAQPTRVLLAGRDGVFSEANEGLRSTATADDGPLLVFDADGDGRNDLLVTAAGTVGDLQPRLFFGEGGGRFSQRENVLPRLQLSAGAAVAADFNRDGRLDLFLGARLTPGRYPAAPRSALWLNRGGTFEDATDALAPELLSPGLVTSALATDADNDGWIDLLLALEWGKVTCLRNAEGKGFEDATERLGFGGAGTGWWSSLASADFNEDGRLDYVAGNVGLNTPYRASEVEPALIYFGAFRGRSEPLLVEAYHEGGEIYPRRARNELGAFLPALLKRFPRHDVFAKASLPTLLGAETLAKAQVFAATTFSSGVFLSQPDGRFVFQPLPRSAQLAPLQGIAAGDWDGDGHADLYALQNSSAPIASVGRFAGGLSILLRGDGRGGFVDVPLSVSGLIVPGDARALLRIDVEGDGAPEWFATRNGARSLLFRKTPAQAAAEPAAWFAVSLRGGPGNRNAVGARAVYAEGGDASQTQEVSAGSTVYSQGSGALFFRRRPGNAPSVLRVRWPDGSTSEHALRRSERKHVISQP